MTSVGYSKPIKLEVRLQSSNGFLRNEMGLIQGIVSKHQSQLKEAWHAYFHD